MSRYPSSEDIYAFFHRLIGNDAVLERYKNNKLSLDTLKECSKQQIKDKELLNQTFFNPFPEELIVEVEEDRNKNYWR